MKSTPEIDVAEVKKAGKLLEQTEAKIKRYAESLGLPVSWVSVHTDGNVRVDCAGRLFLGFNKRRNISYQSGYIGPALWEALEEAATTFKAKRKAV